MAEIPRTGHRERLRQKFQSAPQQMAEVELLELLLTYAIPRQDVAPLAAQLLDRFGSLRTLLAASQVELTEVPGVGDATAVLLQLVGQLRRAGSFAAETAAPSAGQPQGSAAPLRQPALFPDSPEDREKGSNTPKPPPPPPTKSDIRAYTNDLIAAALTHLPQVVNYREFSEFFTYLEKSLPYNSANTRKRYTNYLTNRYFPGGDIETPLRQFLTAGPDAAAWKTVLFYETVRAEPAAQFTAEQVVWPALPMGSIAREALKERLQERFPEASEATVSRMIYSLANLYTLTGVAAQQENRLTFQTRPGTLAAFLYVLAAELPHPGIYGFDVMEQGPMRRWLLWDREWLRRQLYNLRDFGVISKISEIDALRHFTLAFDQAGALRHYFEHPRRGELALRETAVTGSPTA